MEETTHDSSSSSRRKSEEKCPPARGIKMKIGGFKTGHCYHKPSDAAIQQESSGFSSGVWLPRLSQDDFDKVMQTTPQDCWQFPTCIYAPTWPIAEKFP